MSLAGWSPTRGLRGPGRRLGRVRCLDRGRGARAARRPVGALRRGPGVELRPGHVAHGTQSATEQLRPSIRNNYGDTIMRVMVLIKGDQDSEAGVLPDEKYVTEMTRYNEDLAKAGVMLAAEG